MATVAATAQDIGCPLTRSHTEEAVVRLLEHIEEGPARDGLRDTPRRVVKALAEVTQGYQGDPADILKTAFVESHEQRVVLRGVHCPSLCENRLLAFVGRATGGFVQGGRCGGRWRADPVNTCSGGGACPTTRGGVTGSGRNLRHRSVPQC